MVSSKRVLQTLLPLLVLCFSMPAVLAGAEDPPSRFFEVPLDATDLVLISALEIEHTEMDCSHLVHYLYQHSGLDYIYADSITLYQGVKAFRRVHQPQAGDLVVWRGHVGIVVDPEEHTFVSALRTGVKVSSYVSHYWKMKGAPRFLHYVGAASIESALTY
jgi:cell wall-associated NlpC family hydrolase